MEYRKIVSVTGLSGLFELVSSRGDGGVVRSLEDNSTKFVSNRIHNFSQLEGIEIYTTDENVNLVEIFDAIKSSNETLPASGADNKTIKAYFEKVFPKLDFERVYVSDMKKMIKWFDILNKAVVEIKRSEMAELDGAAEHTEKNTNTTHTAANKTAAPKNAPAKKINAPRKMA